VFEVALFGREVLAVEIIKQIDRIFCLISHMLGFCRMQREDTSLVLVLASSLRSNRLPSDGWKRHSAARSRVTLVHDAYVIGTTLSAALAGKICQYDQLVPAAGFRVVSFVQFPGGHCQRKSRP
jgi:hypothetical protein